VFLCTDCTALLDCTVFVLVFLFSFASKHLQANSSPLSYLHHKSQQSTNDGYLTQKKTPSQPLDGFDKKKA
jgi:hypothetical protein